MLLVWNRNVTIVPRAVTMAMFWSLGSYRGCGPMWVLVGHTAACSFGYASAVYC